MVQQIFPSLCGKAQALSLKRGHRVLFSQLSFAMNPGRGIWLCGANGVGKSSLLRGLAGYLRFDAGDVDWAYAPQKSAGEKNHLEDVQDQVARQIHYLSMQNAMRSALSLEENLIFSQALLHESHLGFAAPSLDHVLFRCGIARLRDLPFGVLSSGQKQRANLARLLLVPRPIWLLDEPYTALDVDGEALLETLLAEHLANNGVVVLASHIKPKIPMQVLELGQHAAIQVSVREAQI